MAELRLEVLGGLRIKLDGVSIADQLPQKGRALLSYLAVERGEHPRGALAALLWGEFSEADAATNLRQALTYLRRTVNHYLIVTRHTIAFDANRPYWLDSEAFEQQLAEPMADCDADRLRAAVELYRGDFLAGFTLRDAPAFDEWATLQRERLRIKALHALHTLVQHDLARGDYAAGIAHTVRLLALDPWREEAHRQLMWLYIRTGQRSAALAQYQACRRVLQQELGVEPMAETTALYERIKAAQAVRSHPVPLFATPFVGRAAEKAELARCLATPASRLATIVGPGGIGKTRLALEMAAEWSERFLHGVRLVTLASISSADLLVAAISTALGCSLRGAHDQQALICEYLADKDMLLVLDNFEQLVDGGADVLAELLRHAPEVKFVVTSRERLQLHDERLIELGGLEVPPATDADAETWSAVELFVQSARKLRPDFALGTADKPAVARICRLVEGMPLGIELAAAWTRLLSCEQIAAEIERSVEFLSTSLRDVPARHQSIRTVIDHSWRLLTAEESAVMRRLAVFRGGFTREAAAQVAGASLALLRTLVDQSLIRTHNSAQGAPRYHLHELVRQYALEQLDASGEGDAVRDQHLRFFLRLAEAAEPHLSDDEQQGWLEQLDNERDNMRAALAWPLHDGRSDERAELGARLAGALWRFWWVRTDLIEGRRWLEAVVDNDRIPGAIRAKALHGAGVLAHEQGEYAQARAWYERSLALRRALGDQRGIAASLNSLGVVALDEGDYDRARSLYEESLALKRQLGDRRGIAYSLGNLGLVASAQGDYSFAQTLYEEALALCRALGDRLGMSVSLGNLGAVALEQGDSERAAVRFKEALPLFQAMGDQDGIAECCEGLAGVAIASGQPQRAARLCGAGHALREAVGAPLMPVERRRYEAILAAARAQLGETAFSAAYAEGQAMAVAQAIAEAMDTERT